MDSKHYSRVAEHYDRIAGHGPFATLAPGNQGGRKSAYVATVFDVAVLQALRPHAPYEVLLDFGCGTGIFFRHAVTLAKRVVGVDVSEKILGVAAEYCRDQSTITLMRTDGEHIDLPDSSVDCVVARESLCYVSDDRLPAVLAEIGRVLKPGGYICWLEQVSNNPHWQHHPKAPHLVKRSPTSLRNYARTADWEILSEFIVRMPRFPWIYPIWFGCIPSAWAPRLAVWEVAWHKRFGRPNKRWWDALFLFRKP